MKLRITIWYRYLDLFFWSDEIDVSMGFYSFVQRHNIAVLYKTQIHMFYQPEFRALKYYRNLLYVAL